MAKTSPKPVPSPDGAVSASAPRPMKAKPKAGGVRRVTIEPTADGSYIVEVDRRSANEHALVYAEPAKHTAANKAALDALLDKTFGLSQKTEPA